MKIKSEKPKLQNHFPIATIILLILAVSLSKNLKAQDIGSSAIPVAVVHADKSGVPINRYAYGMFSELLSNMFEKGIWAEILSDRKFFYPINSLETLVPKNTRRGFNRWRPVGADSVVIMDKKNPYVGEQSARIILSRSESHGIKQSGIGFAKGRKYTGHIILSADPGAKITVTLAWGTNPEDKQSITLQPLTKAYAKYPLNFSSQGTTLDKGSFEITGTGTGSFSIGTVSLMPADNLKGFRSDLINMLKELNSGIYRWPGGNMLAAYDWHNGIGDRDKRPTVYDYVWNAIEPNDVGTDDYLNLCELLNIDPYIVVNIGFGEARSAAEWVEYVNGSKETPMGKLRAVNGHPEPYKVKIWGIGNEMYGVWQLGHISIEHYIIKHKMFADAMRKVDPSIKIVACGATIYEINRHQDEINPHHILSPDNPRVILPVEKIPYKIGSLEDWSYQLLAHDADYFDYLAEHVYPAFGSAYDESLQKFVPVQDSLPERVRKTANRIKGAAETMHEYIKLMPQLKAKNITLFIDEWSSGSRTYEGTLVVAEAMHEIFRNSDVISMSGFTSFAGNISWNANEAVYSSVGLFYKLYQKHFGTFPLKITGNSPQKELKGTVLVDKPEKSSGSDTYPLDVMAALSADKKKLTLSVINPTFNDQEIDISFDKVSLKPGYTCYQIKPQSIKAVNRPGEQPGISVVEINSEKTPGTFKILPLSITLYEMNIND